MLVIFGMGDWSADLLRVRRLDRGLASFADIVSDTFHSVLSLDEFEFDPVQIEVANPVGLVGKLDQRYGFRDALGVIAEAVDFADIYCEHFAAPAFLELTRLSLSGFPSAAEPSANIPNGD